MTTAAVILAGGRSSRMGGGDKTLLRLGGGTMLSQAIARLAPQAERIALNANGDPARFAVCGLPVIADATGDFDGPLAGVAAALEWGAAQGARRVLTVAGDTPFFPADLHARLAATPPDAIAVAASQGRAHPTFALWPVALKTDLDAFLESGERRATTFVARHPSIAVDFPPVTLGGTTIDPFFNVNTPDDLAEAERFVAQMRP